ncbi:MAG: iron complex outermembrane recepter protein [Chitinophagaceae bacterium]|nr:MAG: iron complex outermembrane recepter protein [Chitinophagaceae bacterium]
MKRVVCFLGLMLCITAFGKVANASGVDFAEIKMAKGNLEGKVVDASTGKPLVGAAIYLHEAKTGTISGADGNYKSAAVPLGKYLVEVSYVGYASFLEVIDITKNEQRNFSLKLAVVENEGVTVTGVASATKIKQSAQPVSIVKKTDLLKTSSTNIIDALARLVPGVSSLSTGPAISKPIIRGLGYNRVITIHDGIRQEGQQWGDEHGIEVDEYSIQKVEVLKGPASLLYGSDGMGGAVHLITNSPIEQGMIRGNINSQLIDNNGLIGANANLAGHLASGFNWNVYGSIKSAKDYQNKYDGSVLNSRFNERNFGGYLGINKSWGYSHLLVSSFNQNIGVVEGERDNATGKFLAFAGSPVERIATNSDLNSRDVLAPNQGVRHFKIALDNSISVGTGRLAVNIGYQRNHRKEYGDPLQPKVPGLHFDLQTINYNIQYQFAELNGWRTAMGVNGMYQQNRNLAEEVLIPAYNQMDAGVFVYTRKTFNNNFTLSGGLRGDYRKLNSYAANDENGNPKFVDFNKSFGNFSGSIGMSYNASEALTFKANISRGYRAPSVSELASNGTHEGTNRYEYGDQQLKTETSLQLDAGLELNTEHVSFMLNAFYNNIHNYIFYSKLESKLGGDSLVNVGGEDLMAFKFKQSSASLYGFEAKIDLHPHPLDWLHISNSFSMVAGRFNESFEGTNKLPFIPPARLLTELRGDFKKAGNQLNNLYVKVEIDNMFTQNRVFTAFNTESVTPGYTLLNIGTGADLLSKGKTFCSIYFSLNNLADVAYQNHLSRIKYAAENTVTGRQGVFNMGRNFSVKLNVPLSWRVR